MPLPKPHPADPDATAANVAETGSDERQLTESQPPEFARLLNSTPQTADDLRSSQKLRESVVVGVAGMQADDAGLQGSVRQEFIDDALLLLKTAYDPQDAPLHPLDGPVSVRFVRWMDTYQRALLGKARDDLRAANDDANRLQREVVELKGKLAGVSLYAQVKESHRAEYEFKYNEMRRENYALKRRLKAVQARKTTLAGTQAERVEAAIRQADAVQARDRASAPTTENTPDAAEHPVVVMDQDAWDAINAGADEASAPYVSSNSDLFLALEAFSCPATDLDPCGHCIGPRCNAFQMQPGPGVRSTARCTLNDDPDAAVIATVEVGSDALATIERVISFGASVNPTPDLNAEGGDHDQ